jgi:hypothetical protein
MYKYSCPCFNKSVFNWTFYQLLYSWKKTIVQKYECPWTYDDSRSCQVDCHVPVRVLVRIRIDQLRLDPLQTEAVPGHAVAIAVGVVVVVQVQVLVVDEPVVLLPWKVKFFIYFLWLAFFLSVSVSLPVAAGLKLLTSA